MNLHNDQPERPDEVGPVENLLNRRMAKAVSMMGLPPRDAENVCTRCGAPAVHCQCIGADGRRKCCGGIDPSCDGAAVCADHGWREVERLHAELVAAHARIDVLSELLGDLLNDCDNWGIVPHTRYEEALA